MFYVAPLFIDRMFYLKLIPLIDFWNHAFIYTNWGHYLYLNVIYIHIYIYIYIYQWINCVLYLQYFYSGTESDYCLLIAIDQCDDPDKRTRKFACFAVKSWSHFFYGIFFTSNTVSVEYNLFLIILLLNFWQRPFIL